MSNINLKTELSNLLQLQVVDSEIYILKAEKTAKPEQIKAIEAGFEEEKKGFANLEKAALDLQKLRKDRELELATKEENVKKSQGQLYQLKTNKEYQAKLTEIDGFKADASAIEDKIIEVLDKIEQAKAETEKEKQKLQEKEKVFNEEKKKVEIRIKEIDDRLAQLEAQRKQITININAKILTQYDRILLNREGLAIVSVKNNSCGGCNMFVPHQVVNMVKMYDHIVVCEACNRILYTEE